MNNLNILGDTITEVIKNFISFALALSDIWKAALQTGVSLMWSLLKTKGMLPQFQALIEQCRDTVRSKITLSGLVQKLAKLNLEFVKSFTKLISSRQDDKDEEDYKIDVSHLLIPEPVSRQSTLREELSRLLHARVRGGPHLVGRVGCMVDFFFLEEKNFFFYVGPRIWCQKLDHLSLPLFCCCEHPLSYSQRGSLY